MQYSLLEGINIGSGQHYAPGWWNVDIIPTDIGKQPDQLIDIFSLPVYFDEPVFNCAYIGHVLEHIDYNKVPDALRAIADVVLPGSKIMVVGPCIDKALTTNQPQSLIDAIRAPENPDRHPWGHKWTPTEPETARAIIKAGWVPEIMDIKEVKRPLWPNPSTACWQTALQFTT